MPRFTLALWVLTTFSAVYGRQIPLHFEGENTHWDLNIPPGDNSTDHLVFDTVSSLLQHWPNTRHRNGHNIVPGSIPRGTHLYHGAPWHGPEVPTVPEWLATDPQHSYLFCLAPQGEGCWHLTFVTTRTLNVLYFDGSGAQKMLGGSMDSQDILLWGEVRPEWTEEEEKRINELCAWGKDFGIDAFVRMSFDFEIMMCDFSNGLQLVSKLQVVSPIIYNDPSGDPRQAYMRDRAVVAAVEAGALHNFPGDPRIQLDLSRLVSFYDTELVPSLILSRFRQSRFEHRLQNISSHDVQAAMNTITGVLTHPEQSSGIDWKGLFRIITLRYSDRLQVIQHHLNATEVNRAPHIDTVGLVLDQLKTILAPYLLHSAVPSLEITSSSSSWAAPVFQHCATTPTDFATSISSELTYSERLLLRAAQGTNREICRVVVKMWVDAVVEGLDPSFQSSQSPRVDLNEKRMGLLLKSWRTDLNGLLRWLDWSVWAQCRPGCSFEEMCYMPTWNLFRGRDKAYWREPKPRCVRRVEPYAIETW